MSLYTPPKAGVPIGWANINGQRVKVDVDPEYLKFFFRLHRGLDAVDDVRLRRLLWTFDDCADLTAVYDKTGFSPDLGWNDTGVTESLITSGFGGSQANVTKAIRVTSPVANGSAVHTGAYKNGWFLFFSSVSDQLAALNLAPGDILTTTFYVNARRVSGYAGADAGGYLYPSVMYNQKDDWTNKIIKIWAGDPWNISWGIGQQQAQSDEYFGTTMWAAIGAGDYLSYPMAVSYDRIVCQGDITNNELVSCLTAFHLWGENQVQIDLLAVEFIARRGVSV